MTYDPYTAPQRRYDLSRAIMGQAMTPTRGATAAEGIGRILQMYLADRGMRGAEAQSQAVERAGRAKMTGALSNALSAYRGDSGPLYPGTGSNRAAMAESLMGSNIPALEQAGITALMADPKANKPSVLIDQLTQHTRHASRARRLHTLSRGPACLLPSRW